MSEIIGDKEKGFDFTETIKPEVIETPTYDYGRSQEPLDYQLLKNKPSVNGGNFKIGYFKFNSTGNVSITGVGFKPKLVMFTYTDQIGGYGTGAMTETDLFGYDVLGVPSQIQTECIYLRNSGGTTIGRAIYVSMDNDGFTINITLASKTIYVNYIAFG